MGSLIRASTGIGGLDRAVNSLRLGDNVVWQVDTIADYKRFVSPFIKSSLKEGRKVIYMRFASHEPLVEDSPAVKVCRLDALGGFELFSSQVYEIITEEGEEAYYVFDCLSDLLPVWASDLMIGNFFAITCPYLFELDTVTYFALLRRSHSFRTIARIRETTQLLLDVYTNEGKYYVHPLKVWNRYSPTMFLPHVMEEGELSPVTSSVDVSRLFSMLSGTDLESEKRYLDYWDRLFLHAADIYVKVQNNEPGAQEEQVAITSKLFRLMIGRENKILALAEANLSLKDLLDIRTRMIGSGFIGGKAAGMLIARSILGHDTACDSENHAAAAFSLGKHDSASGFENHTAAAFNWEDHLEPHDSFYIGSDVYYSYIVENGLWRLRMKQREKEGYFEAAPELREKLLEGNFPDTVKERFQQMLDYFGQSPIIVRSSSLLEDAFGNAFAGKYESIFCVNQGTPQQRFKEFETAVRRVYASTMNSDALAYRLQRGLDNRDEQMAILVQRVSGDYHGIYYFPDLAGVGISYNTYVWKSNMDPKAGMLRLVYGLGTRAVDRVEGDYPRVLALDAPLLRPLAGMEDIRRYSQHDVDVLNIENNKKESISVNDIPSGKHENAMRFIAITDHETIALKRKYGMDGENAWVLTFEKLLTDTLFTLIMQRMLKTLETAYQSPVDIEFTANFTGDGALRVNLLQCRPLQVKGLQGNIIIIPENIDPGKIILKAKGNFMGGSTSQNIRRLIYIDPEKYVALSVSGKYELARIVGVLNRQLTISASGSVIPAMLAGPGRWGTSTPSLGVPVTFSEINNMSVLLEIEFSSAGLMPELSFGTHFFQDLVETGIFYAAVFPDKQDTILETAWMEHLPNMLAKLVPGKEHFAGVIKVYDIDEPGIILKSDIVSQKIICYRE